MFELDRLAERARDKVQNRDRFGRIDDAIDDTYDYIRERVRDVIEPVYDWVEQVVGAFTCVLERITVIYPVHFERWLTASDERVCPECGPIDGRVWETGSGVYPPLHVNCRCARVLAWTEWRSRYVEDWRLRWMTWSEWEWRITGWR